MRDARENRRLNSECRALILSSNQTKKRSYGWTLIDYALFVFIRGFIDLFDFVR